MRSLLAILSLASAQAAQYNCVYNVTIPRWARLNVGDAVCNGDVALTLHTNRLALTRDPKKFEDAASSQLLWAAMWGNTGFTGVAAYAHVDQGEFYIKEQETDNVLWRTGTENSGATTLDVDNQGFWAMHALGQMVWRAPALAELPTRPDADRIAWSRLVAAVMQQGSGLLSSGPTKSHPKVMTKLYPDARLTAKDGTFLVYQMDGNVVLHGANGTALWDAGCSSASPRFVCLHTDGSLRAYDKNKMYWKSFRGRSELNTYLLVIGDSQLQILQSPSIAVGPLSIWRKP